jgi:peptidyl-prolyl cis-trans isomerase C
VNHAAPGDASSRRSSIPSAARAVAAAFALLAAAAGGCRCGARGPGAEPVAEFAGGTVTAAELTREANRLAPALRQQFETPAGRRELVGAMIDKRLLVAEARRRELDTDPEIRRQVSELEERLVVQALLAAEERRAGSPSDAELRAWFASHRAELSQPERVRVLRVLVAVAPGAPERDRAEARQRAQRLADRLRRGEVAAKVAAEGDGPERFRGGDHGFVVRGMGADPALEEASFALARPGAVSPVFACKEGFAAVALVERHPAREVEFEDVRSEVENRMTPGWKRKVFDDLIERLRQDADVKYVGLTNRS